MKVVLLIISIVFSLPTFAVTPAEFQGQLEQLNAVFSAGEGLLGPQYPVKKLRVEMGEALPESQSP